MTRWSIAEAKARFSQVLEKADEEPQEITNRGRSVAVVVSRRDWDAATSRTGSSGRTPMERFLQLTEELKASGDLDLRIPRRRRDRKRASPFDA